MYKPSNYTNLPGEEWRVIPYLPDYDISNMGRIRSSRPSSNYGTNSRVLVGSLDKDGYRRVTIPYLGRRHYLRIAKIVAEIWLGQCPRGLVVCHKDGNLHNDRADNLEYKTQKENIYDKFRHGTMACGTRNGNVKLTEEQVIEIFTSTEPALSIAARFGVSRTPIDYIRKRKTWRHITDNLI